jgi:hypothetical protein
MGNHKIHVPVTTNQLTINGSIILSCLVFHWIIPATTLWYWASPADWTRGKGSTSTRDLRTENLKIKGL